MHVLWFKKF